MSPKILGVEVVYHWKLTRSMSGCDANKSSPNRAVSGLKVEQFDNLAPGVVGVESGTSPPVELLLSVPPKAICPVSLGDLIPNEGSAYDNELILDLPGSCDCEVGTSPRPGTHFPYQAPETPSVGLPVVKDPLSPPGPPRIPDSLCEASSVNSLVTSKQKETGMVSSGKPAIICRVKSGEIPQLRSKCDPDSNPLDSALCSWDPTGVDLGLDLHLNAESPRSESENSGNSVASESVPEVGIPRSASCPAMGQLCTQQTGQLPVLSAGCNAPFAYLPIGPSFAEILCRGIDAGPPDFLVGGKECWPISEEDRLAALGLVGAPVKLDPQPTVVAVPKLECSTPLLPPVTEQYCGPVVDPPGTLDLAGDLVTPPSISRIITKYSLDTSYQLGHGSSSPIGLSAAPRTDSHLDTPEVSHIGSIVAPSQKESWQPVKSRRTRKFASKNSKGERT
ncbi:hypothetical protein Nepgr_032286 [Nepenthes gracilis]|uniref:Uncharacterized protein n=1 Tax=Nepenthes gracilis TaxID=150966 RepID=A0AAD3TK53_NEPGR|nr:hypothetical protein Nepgr_032286 [Nepenthes gracilis]